MNKEKILGYKVTSNNIQGILKEVGCHIKNKEKATIFAINPEKVIAGNKDEKLKKTLNESTFLIPDGTGIVMSSKRRKGAISERVTGVDLFVELLSESIVMGWSVFFYGAEKEVIDNLVKSIEEILPEINIAGYIDGFSSDKDVIAAINEKKPDIVFVALGSPKQEYWIESNMDKLQAYIFQGVGGSFDVLSGKVTRAPKWMQKSGLEWLYRLIKEPSRIIRQIKLLRFIPLMLKGEDNE